MTSYFFRFCIGLAPIDDSVEYTEKIIDFLKSLPLPFALKGKLDIHFPNKPNEHYLSKSLNRSFVDGRVGGNASIYSLQRESLADKRVDHIYFTFDHSVAVSFADFVGVVDAFVATFPVQSVALIDEDFRDKFSDAARNLARRRYLQDPIYDLSHGVFLFQLLHFFSNQFCERSFGVRSEELYDRLNGKIPECKMMGGGVFVRFFNELPTHEQLLEINRIFRPLIGGVGLYQE